MNIYNVHPQIDYTHQYNVHACTHELCISLSPRLRCKLAEDDLVGCAVVMYHCIIVTTGIYPNFNLRSHDL